MRDSGRRKRKALALKASECIGNLRERERDEGKSRGGEERNLEKAKIVSETSVGGLGVFSLSIKVSYVSSSISRTHHD